MQVGARVVLSHREALAAEVVVLGRREDLAARDRQRHFVVRPHVARDLARARLAHAAAITVVAGALDRYLVQEQRQEVEGLARAIDQVAVGVRRRALPE